jgi:hypothetical protein
VPRELRVTKPRKKLGASIQLTRGRDLEAIRVQIIPRNIVNRQIQRKG